MKEVTPVSKEKVLQVLDATATTATTVAEIVEATGLSDSVVRKALKALCDDGLCERHETNKPTTYTKAYSLEATVAQFLGRKARSASYITKRIRQRGAVVSTPMVSNALLALVGSGRAAAPFKSARRFRRP
jgi:DNA-binding IclR family transcriptional regulator